MSEYVDHKINYMDDKISFKQYKHTHKIAILFYPFKNICYYF